MLMELVFTGVGSFIAGGFVSLVAFVLPMSSKLARLETKIDGHLQQNIPLCSLHNSLSVDFAGVRKQVEVNTQRLDILERKC